MTNRVAVDVKLVGETRKGAWCEICLLSTVIVQDFEFEIAGTHETKVASAFYCVSCEDGRFWYR